MKSQGRMNNENFIYLPPGKFPDKLDAYLVFHC